MGKMMKHSEWMSLRQVVGRVQTGELKAVQSEIRQLYGVRQETPDDTLYALMLQGLFLRMNRGNDLQSNLYTRTEDAQSIPQIRLFDILANQFPLITLSRQIANVMLDSMLPPATEEVTLLSIGIGSARQEADFLKLLAARDQPPKQIHVVGIEPAPVSLTQAAETLRAQAGELGLVVQFHPVCKLVESMTQADWDAIRALPGALLISESFALHHTGLTDAGTEARDEILVRLKALNSDGFVLIEPSSDHVEPNLIQRFENCWTHFQLVFQVIDRMAIEPAEKEAIKRLFFGREIEDILSADELGRHERHETIAQWQSRLNRAGFKAPQTASFKQFQNSAITRLKNYGTYIGLDVHGQTVVAVIGVK